MGIWSHRIPRQSIKITKFSIRALGVILIQRCQLTNIGIPITKAIWVHDHLIIIMEIPTAGKTVTELKWSLGYSTEMNHWAYLSHCPTLQFTDLCGICSAIKGSFHKQITSSYIKISSKCVVLSIVINSYIDWLMIIKLSHNFYTYQNSWALMTHAKLWLDLMIINIIWQDEFSWDFNYRLIKNCEMDPSYWSKSI